MKYKTVHSIGDFIGLPHRLSDPAMIYYAYYKDSEASTVSKQSISEVLNGLYSFVSTDYLANMDKITFDDDLAMAPRGPPKKVRFNAWNPYLDASLLGRNYVTYAAMYNYFKYRGIKVKWIPNVRTAGLMQPKINGMKIENSTISASIGVQTPVTASRTTGSTVLEYQNAAQFAAYSNNVTEGGGLIFDTVHPAALSEGSLIIPKYNDVVPNYEKNVGYAPTLKMHVLFSKDDYVSSTLPANPVTGEGDLKETVYKTKTYKYNTKTQNYKIYDMSKSFKFYCRPYCASKADEVTGYSNESDKLDDNTKLYKGDTIIKKKTRLPRQVVNFDSMTNLVDPANTAVINKWQSRLSDSNFLNPILFGYFFTVDGIDVDDWMYSIEGLTGTMDFDSCVPKFSKFLSSYGHFEITTYATFNELNNTYNNIN